ncbi:acyl-CoA dehydrogenase family protein [Monashia sp. NPDC004114]
MSEEAAEFGALADELLAAGHVDQLVGQLGDPELAELWDDPGVVGAVAEAHGRHLASSPLMDVAVLRSDGSALVLDVPGGSGPACMVTGDRIEVDGTARDLRSADRLVLLVDGVARRVDLGLLALAAADGFDPGLSLTRVTGSVPLHATELLDVDAATLISRVARFVAHELVGVAEGALDLACAHVRDRRQFGVPIGSFQAVRHRLAEAHVQVTAARELLAAIPGADTHPDTDPDTHPDTEVLVLKASAGFAAQTAVAAAQQVCGGMGFTEEFGLHRFVRRALMLDSLLVGCEDAEEALGRLALAGRVLPDRQVVLL